MSLDTTLEVRERKVRTPPLVTVLSRFMVVRSLFTIIVLKVLVKVQLISKIILSEQEIVMDI